MVRTKVTLRKGEDIMDPGSGACHETTAETLVTSAPPSPAQETPPQPKEMMKQIAEAEQLEEVGRLPQSLPTWQLAQMVAETRPSMLSREESTRKKLCTTVWGKAPRKEFLKAGVIKKRRKHWPGMVALHKIHQLQRAQSSLFGNSPSHG